MAFDWPNLDQLRPKLRRFAAYGADRTYREFREATAPSVDLARREHRERLLGWLNQWGCRIRYPLPGEHDPFDENIARWWSAWSSALPPTGVALARLTDRQLDALGRAFDALSGTVVVTDGPGRSLGPTAAAKTLFALRPRAVTPWDRNIARTLYGGTSAAHFHQHLLDARRCARAILSETPLSERSLAKDLRRDGMTLAKLLDEYWYVTIVRDGERQPPVA